MKKFITLLLTAIALSTDAYALPYSEARDRAWYLTDKMAYELNLTQEQYDKAYEINLDYFMSVNTPADANSIYWQYRNTDLRYILLDWQYNLFAATSYFFNPLLRVNGMWVLASFNFYDRNFYFFSRPVIVNVYKGHSWRPRPQVSPYIHFRIAKGHGLRDRYLAAHHGKAPAPRKPHNAVTGHATPQCVPGHDLSKNKPKEPIYEWRNPGKRNSHISKPAEKGNNVLAPGNKRNDTPYYKRPENSSRNNNLRYTSTTPEIHFSNSYSTTQKRSYTLPSSSTRNNMQTTRMGSSTRITTAATAKDGNATTRNFTTPQRKQSRTNIFGGGAKTSNNQATRTSMRNFATSKQESASVKSSATNNRRSGTTKRTSVNNGIIRSTRSATR